MNDRRGQLPVLRTRFRLALLFALLLVPGTAGAFEIFGLRLFEDQADRDAAAVIADPPAAPEDGAIRLGGSVVLLQMSLPAEAVR